MENFRFRCRECRKIALEDNVIVLHNSWDAYSPYNLEYYCEDCWTIKTRKRVT